MIVLPSPMPNLPHLHSVFRLLQKPFKKDDPSRLLRVRTRESRLSLSQQKIGRNSANSFNLIETYGSGQKTRDNDISGKW